MPKLGRSQNKVLALMIPRGGRKLRRGISELRAGRLTRYARRGGIVPVIVKPERAALYFHASRTA